MKKYFEDPEALIRASCAQQEISREEWKGFISREPYCDIWTKEYWASRFQYWPCFEIKSHALPLEKEKRKPRVFKYQSRLELALNILSEVKFTKAISKVSISIMNKYKFIKTKRENIELLMLDEDLWLSSM